MKKKKSLFWITLVVIAGLLTACGGGQQPTVDPNMIFTQAAQTVSAQLSATAASLPTSTATPEPSPTPTETVAPTATLPLPTVDSASAGTPGGGVTAPTAPSSSDQGGKKAGDSADYSSQMPKDGTKMYPGVAFSLAFTLINTGSTTWGPGYRLKFIGGEQCSTVSSIEIDRTVKPGEKFEFFMAAFAPRSIGKFQSYWGFYNPQNIKIYEVYLTAEVIKE